MKLFVNIRDYIGIQSQLELFPSANLLSQVADVSETRGLGTSSYSTFCFGQECEFFVTTVDCAEEYATAVTTSSASRTAI